MKSIFLLLLLAIILTGSKAEESVECLDDSMMVSLDAGLGFSSFHLTEAGIYCSFPGKLNEFSIPLDTCGTVKTMNKTHTIFTNTLTGRKSAGDPTTDYVVSCAYLKEPCEAGSHMTVDGCVECGANYFSLAAAEECTLCPDSKFSAAGSTSADDCYLRNAVIEIRSEDYTTRQITATLACIDQETNQVISLAMFVNANFIGSVSEAAGEIDVPLSCDAPLWSCMAPGYIPAIRGINIAVYTADTVKTSDIIDEGTSIMLDSDVTDPTLIVNWNKGSRTHGLARIEEDVTSIEVSEAGHYEARISRCPDHIPALKTFNVVTQKPDFTPPADKLCYVYGDPHIQTFDGQHYDYQGECTYVLAMDCSNFDWYVYGKFVNCGDGVTCLASLTVVTKSEPIQQYATSVGACRGGESPANSAGRTQYMDELCRERCNADPYCSGYVKGSGWCENYFSKGATGDGRDQFTCHSKAGVKYDPVMFEIKRGFGINDNGVMKGVSEGETMKIGDAALTFDGLFLKVDNGKFELEFDGLAFAKITVAEGTKSCGLCGDNDGDRSNDEAHSMYDVGDSDKSFADTWAVTNKAGACGVNPLDSIEVVQESTDAVNEYVTDSTMGDVVDFSQEFLAAAALDNQSVGNDGPFSKPKFMECSSLRAMMAQLKDNQGVTFDRWDIDMKCPSPREVLLEGVRLGCPWTKANAPFYIPGTN